MENLIKNRIEESIKVKEAISASQAGNIGKASGLITETLKNGGKILIFGNGGSAADSQHMAAELVGRFKKERKALAAIALTANTSILTAIANDYGCDVIFSRQVEALGKKGDVAFGISTSGNSRNVIEAINKARSMGLKTVALVGNAGGKLKNICDATITASSKDTARIQEAHITVIHIICELVEEAMSK